MYVGNRSDDDKIVTLVRYGQVRLVSLKAHDSVSVDGAWRLQSPDTDILLQWSEPTDVELGVTEQAERATGVEFIDGTVIPFNQKPIDGDFLYYDAGVGAFAWTAGTSSDFTSADAQDAVGAILADTTSINLAYNSSPLELTASANFGTGSGTVCQGNDARLSDARTPLSHDHSSNKLNQANTHQNADTDSGASSLHHTIGSGAYNAAAGNHSHAQLHDAVTVTDSSSVDFTLTGQQITADVVGLKFGSTTLANSGTAPTTGQYLKYDGSYIVGAAGGGGGSYTNEEAQDAVGGILANSTSVNLTYGDSPAAITASANFGTGSGQICQGNDSRLSDARTPLSHDHSGNKLNQANTHEAADTDSGASSLHHTIGTGAYNAAAGNHSHAQLHDAVTVTDSSSIDFTLTGQQITADAVGLKFGSTTLANSGTAPTTGQVLVFDGSYLAGSAAVADLQTMHTDIKDPTGWLAPENLTLTYSVTDRKFTLSGTLVYYWRGEKKTLTSPWTSTAHDEGDGKYYLRSTDGTNFTWSPSPWTFSDLQVGLAVVAQSGAVKIGLRELHGMMPWETHHVIHHTVGTYVEEGGTLDGNTYTVNVANDTATTPGVLAAEVHDEDNEYEVAAWTQGTYTTMRIGASSVATFDTAASFPFRAGASYIYVNNPTTGAETATENNRYVNVYGIYTLATSDTDSAKYRLVWLQPQAAYTSLAAAQAENPAALSYGSFTDIAVEFTIRIRITYVTASGDANTGKCRIATGGVSYLAGGRYNAVSIAGATAITAAAVPITAIAGMSATNVQEALSELNSQSIPYSRLPPEVEFMSSNLFGAV